MPELHPSIASKPTERLVSSQSLLRKTNPTVVALQKHLIEDTSCSGGCGSCPNRQSCQGSASKDENQKSQKSEKTGLADSAPLILDKVTDSELRTLTNVTNLSTLITQPTITAEFRGQSQSAVLRKDILWSGEVSLAKALPNEPTEKQIPAEIKSEEEVPIKSESKVVVIQDIKLQLDNEKKDEIVIPSGSYVPDVQIKKYIRKSPHTPLETSKNKIPAELQLHPEGKIHLADTLLPVEQKVEFVNSDYPILKDLPHYSRSPFVQVLQSNPTQRVNRLSAIKSQVVAIAPQMPANIKLSKNKVSLSGLKTILATVRQNILAKKQEKEKPKIIPKEERKGDELKKGEKPKIEKTTNKTKIVRNNIRETTKKEAKKKNNNSTVLSLLGIISSKISKKKREQKPVKDKKISDKTKWN